MTSRFPHEPDAKARIQAMTQSELQAFFDEVPAEAMRLLSPYLPPVDGFRPGSKSGINRQKEILAHRLGRPSANEYDFNALYVIWRTWIDENQPNASSIQNLIDELEEAVDATDSPEARRLAIEDRASQLLERLRDESQENRLSRETIQRLFAFSPLPETDRIQRIISEAKPAADVERDLAFCNLPKRLVQDERKLESIALELTDLKNQITESNDELSKLKDSIQEVRTIVNGAQAWFDERDRVDRQQEEERANTKARIQSLGEDIHTLRQKLDDVGSQRTQLFELQEAIAQLITTHEGWSRSREDDLGRIDSLDATLADATGNVAQLVEELQRLEQRVDNAEASFTKKIGHTQVSRSRTDCEARQLTPRALEKGENAVPIGTHSDLTAAFKHSLEWLGLRKSAAEIFAEECTAAVASRQAIFLQGAYAARVARALVQTVGGSNSFCLSIPVGIQDGVDIRRTIEEAFALEGKWVGGLALEGINHAPLDITGEIIRDCVDPAVDGPGPIGGRAVVIATLSRGIASLPVEPEYLELGPVFDIDYLDWRTNVPTVEAPHASFLPEGADRSIYEHVRSSNANVEEVVHLARALVHKKSPAIERNVVRAFHALHVIRSDQKSVTPLHSLFFGWLLPYWRALGLPKEAIDIEFDGGNVHGAPPDQRLTAVFEAEFSEQSQVRV